MGKTKTVTHYDWLGNSYDVEEHEEQIMTSYGLLTKSQLKAINEDKRMHPERYKQPTNPIKSYKHCPFGRNAIGHSVCAEDGCAMYDNGRCGALACTPCHKGMCPHNNETCCKESCMAYHEEVNEE